MICAVGQFAQLLDSLTSWMSDWLPACPGLQLKRLAVYSSVSLFPSLFISIAWKQRPRKASDWGGCPDNLCSFYACVSTCLKWPKLETHTHTRYTHYHIHIHTHTRTLHSSLTHSQCLSVKCPACCECVCVCFCLGVCVCVSCVLVSGPALASLRHASCIHLMARTHSGTNDANTT